MTSLSELCKQYPEIVQRVVDQKPHYSKDPDIAHILEESGIKVNGGVHLV